MHEEHRKRMYNKLKSNVALLDHELLETLLFSVYPRINTNPIAHGLLDKFGTLAGVFDATVEQLVSVKGVGENCALFLKCVGECMRRTADDVAGIAALSNFSDLKNFVIARMRGKTSEVLEFYFADKNGKVLSIKNFTCDNREMVSIGADDIGRVIATEKPYGLFAAHNHLSGNSTPSDSDDKFTVMLQTLCSIYNVKFYDHCIYAADTDIFSYRGAGELDEIKENFTFNQLINDKMERLTQKK